MRSQLLLNGGSPKSAFDRGRLTVRYGVIDRSVGVESTQILQLDHGFNSSSLNERMNLSRIISPQAASDAMGHASIAWSILAHE
jgi:hypothetical protein